MYMDWICLDNFLVLETFILYIFCDQVAAAADNPAYQPWKPNCQMTPNQEDIIGGRWVEGMVIEPQLKNKSENPANSYFFWLRSSKRKRTYARVCQSM